MTRSRPYNQSVPGHTTSAQPPHPSHSSPTQFTRGVMEVTLPFMKSHLLRALCQLNNNGTSSPNSPQTRPHPFEMCGLSSASAGAHTKAAFEAASPPRGPGACRVLCGTAPGGSFWRAALQPALRTDSWTWTPKAQRAASATALPQCPSWGQACQLLAPARQPGEHTREGRGAPNVGPLPGPIRTGSLLAALPCPGALFQDRAASPGPCPPSG